MTRLVQLCCDPGIAYGGTKGAAVHLRELGRALGAAGADVLTIVTRMAPDAAEPPPGVTVEVLPGRSRRTGLDAWLAAEPARAEWIERRAAHWRADAIYERLSLHTAAGSVAARALRRPHLVEVNTALVAEAARYRTLPAPELAAALEDRVLAAADCVLAVSSPLADHAAARGARRVELCPNAVDPGRFPTAAAAGTNPPRAVFAGSLRPWHGARTLADAWARLGSAAPALLVVGDGAGRDELLAVGATVTGMVPHACVPGLLAGAQIGVAPYPADAPSYFSPLKLFEYLAAGLAVVAADLPGVREVARGVAVLVPPGDPAALAAAVRALVDDPASRGALGAAARARAFAEHTWGQRARAVLDLVADLRAAIGVAG